MSYIITADVYLDEEENSYGEIVKVNARILSKQGSCITFDIAGDHSRKRKRTKMLCDTLINAGFYSFNIRHSY